MPRKRIETIPNPAVLPLMDRESMAREMASGRSGLSVALLDYHNGHFEMVSGDYNVIPDEQPTFWVGDRLVGVLGSGGTPDPVPGLVSLRIGISYPLDTLTTQRLEPVT